METEIFASFINTTLFTMGASLIAQLVKNLPAMQETRFDFWVWKIPWRRKWQPTLVFLPRKCHGQRSWWATVHGVSRVGHDLVSAAAAAKSLQSRPTLCDPIDGSPPGSSVPRILQARPGVGCHFLLQCMKVKVKSLSCVWLFATPWTAAYQALPSMGFSSQEYWSGVHCLLLGRHLGCMKI